MNADERRFLKPETHLDVRRAPRAPGPRAGHRLDTAAADPLREIDAVHGDVGQRPSVLALLEVPLCPSVRISRPVVERMLAAE